MSTLGIISYPTTLTSMCSSIRELVLLRVKSNIQEDVINWRQLLAKLVFIHCDLFICIQWTYSLTQTILY